LATNLSICGTGLWNFPIEARDIWSDRSIQYIVVGNVGLVRYIFLWFKQWLGDLDIMLTGLYRHFLYKSDVILRSWKISKNNPIKNVQIIFQCNPTPHPYSCYYGLFQNLVIQFPLECWLNLGNFVLISHLCSCDIWTVIYFRLLNSII